MCRREDPSLCPEAGAGSMGRQEGMPLRQAGLLGASARLLVQGAVQPGRTPSSLEMLPNFCQWNQALLPGICSRQPALCCQARGKGAGGLPGKHSEEIRHSSQVFPDKAGALLPGGPEALLFFISLAEAAPGRADGAAAMLLQPPFTRPEGHRRVHQCPLPLHHFTAGPLAGQGKRFPLIYFG